MAKTVHTAYLIAGESAAEDESGQIISAKRTYRVLEAFAATAATAMAATGLPASNSVHPDYPNLRVMTRTPTLQSNGIEWLIDFEYKQGNGPVVADQYNTRRLEYGTHSIQEDVLVNIATGEPLLDANKKPFESTVQEAREYPYIKIVKQMKTMSRDNILNLSGTINNADIVVAGVTIPEHCGKIKITAVEQTEAVFPWEISFEVLVRYHDLKNYVDFNGSLEAGPDEVGWDIGILNRGFYYYSSTGSGTGANRATENILDITGNVVERKPTASPVPLKLDGSILEEGETPIAIRIQTIRSADWTPLGLNSL